MDKLAASTELRIATIVKLASDDPDIIGAAIGKIACEIGEANGLDEQEIDKLAAGLIAKGVSMMGKLLKGKKPVGAIKGSAGARVDAAARATIAKSYGSPAVKGKGPIVKVM